MQSTTNDKLKEEAFRKAQEQQARSQQQSPSFNPNNSEENQPNLIDNIGQLFADRLTKPVLDSVFKHLGLNLEAEVNRMIASQPKERSGDAMPSSFDVFVSSQVQSYGTNNIRVISSSSVSASASLPSTSVSNGQTTNGNGKGFEPKN